MASQTHLFVMDPFEKLNLKLDTSLRLAFELAQRGDRIYICEPRHIAWSSERHTAHCKARPVEFSSRAEQTSISGASETLDFAFFDGIHMRKDPPFDMSYVGTTWLLDAAMDKTKVLNNPQALRDYNEKLAILQFPQDILPALISSDPEEIFDFLVRSANGDAILKPLDLFGGAGVKRITTTSEAENARLLQQLREETKSGQELRLVQPFDSRIYDGEVRAFCVAGKPLSWCLKRPLAGSFLANTGAGATLEAYQPTEEELERVIRVSNKLLQHGIFVVGFDLIGGLVSEINVTSPRLLQGSNDDTNYFITFADKVREYCQSSEKNS